MSTTNQSGPPTQRHRLQRYAGWPLDHPWYILLVVGFALFIYWAASTRSQSYQVKAQFASAFNIVQGQPVDIEGLGVGMVDGILYDKHIGGAAGGVTVTLGIGTKQWVPLHQGTHVNLRWGSTIGNGTRRIDVIPGPSSAPALSNGSYIPVKDTLAPVDVDQIQDVFTPQIRNQLTGMLASIHEGIAGQANALHAGINNAGPALGAANGVFNDLTADTNALNSLITNGAELTHTLAARAPTVESLVGSAGTTFAKLSENSDGLQASIQDLSPALVEARGTLVDLDHSVGILTGLVNAVRPGAAELPDLATQLDPTLADLHSVVPNGVSTLHTATAAAPSLTRLLGDATPLITNVRYDTSQLAPMVACVRPYAPDAASGVWGAGDWVANYDLERPDGTPGLHFYGANAGNGEVRAHGVRAMPEFSAASLHGYPPGLTTQQFVNINSDIGLAKEYAFIRPPGYSAAPGGADAWYQPQCGITPSVMDPANDPEDPTK